MSQKILDMEVDNPWFLHLKNKTKTIEGRKGGKWSNLQGGDSLRLTCGSDSFVVTVVDVRKYKNVRDYLETEGLEKTLPYVKTVEEGIAIYRQWSTKEEVDKRGFLAIEIVRD